MRMRHRPLFIRQWRLLRDWSAFACRVERSARSRSLVVLEDLVVPSLKARVIMVEATLVDQFSHHFRFLVVL